MLMWIRESIWSWELYFYNLCSFYSGYGKNCNWKCCFMQSVRFQSLIHLNCLYISCFLGILLRSGVEQKLRFYKHHWYNEWEVNNIKVYHTCVLYLLFSIDFLLFVADRTRDKLYKLSKKFKFKLFAKTHCHFRQI